MNIHAERCLTMEVDGRKQKDGGKRRRWGEGG